MEDKSINLLAFSGGVDSTALFFKLLEKSIKFDIAIVDYGQRKQSHDEVLYAKKLCKFYNKKCFFKKFPSDLKFTEKTARDFRYEFFEEIIKNENYKTLLTGHQLNDKFEWFLMQFGRGAGFVELNGMQEEENREFYTLKRPLLGYKKSELKEYLDKKNIKYFIDESNFDLKYKRNHIRASYSDKFLEEFSVGVKRSFEYLQTDIDSLFSNITTYSKEQLIIFSNCADDNVSIRLIDRELKRRNLLISSALRVEILAQREIIVSDKIAISITSSQIWIAPKCDKVMDKKFKEKCRINKIPKNIRSYISTINYFL